MKVSYAVISILVAMNIFLLFNGNKVKENYIKLYEEYSEISNNLTTESTNVVENGSIVHPEVNFVEADSGIFLAIFIPQNSCPDCLDYEITNLNQFYTNHEKNVKVYLVARDSLTEKNSNYNIDFTYDIINPTAKLFSVKVPVSNPIAILTDESGTIYSAYFSEIGNEDKSNKFYEKMRKFFQYYEKLITV